MTHSPLIRGYRPGDIGHITALHGKYYAEHWGLGPVFEAEVAVELAEFVLTLVENPNNRLWVAEMEGEILGSIAIAQMPDNPEIARVRWVILSPNAQGKGLGRQLVNTALDFCRTQPYQTVTLWTFKGLTAARRLYDEAGFELVESYEDTHWGKPFLYQKFMLSLVEKANSQPTKLQATY
ncbi:MAG: GNAT family N-acetyltransferase [Vampirovibrio sp.]|nr:GNAT family N-acetyltransferase [Vampirovibrio sp.]